jgi:hypothetical protein
MATLLRVLPALMCLVLGAHFLRAAQYPLVGISAALAVLSFVPRHWAARTVQVALLGGSIVWLETAVRLAMTRAAHGMPWGRMVVILATVALVTALSALVFQARPIRRGLR